MNLLLVIWLCRCADALPFGVSVFFSVSIVQNKSERETGTIISTTKSWIEMESRAMQRGRISWNGHSIRLNRNVRFSFRSVWWCYAMHCSVCKPFFAQPLLHCFCRSHVCLFEWIWKPFLYRADMHISQIASFFDSTEVILFQVFFFVLFSFIFQSTCVHFPFVISLMVLIERQNS